MAFAISTNYKLAVNDEAVWGTPVTTGAKFVRLVSGNAKPELAFTQSNEINPTHRQTADSVMTSAKGSGSLEGELSYNSHEMFMQSLFGATFSGAGTRTLKVGTSLRSLTIQEQYSDLTNIYHLYTGAIVNSMSLNVQVGQIVTCSYGFVSKKPSIAAATGVGTPAATNTNPVINPLADVRVLQEGSPLASITGVQSLSLNVQNDVTEIMTLGTVDPAALIPARFKVTGTIAVFKQDAAIITKLLAGTASKLNIKLGGAANLSYEFTLPNVKYTSYDGGASQSNAIVERFGFEGHYDATDSAFKIVGVD